MEWREGDTAECGRCRTTITFHGDRAFPYWLHQNGFPYCRDADNPEEDPGPCQPPPHPGSS